MSEGAKFEDIVCIWVVEGNYVKRGWQLCEAFATQAQADFWKKRMTIGLHPVWKYRVRKYKPAS